MAVQNPTDKDREWSDKQDELIDRGKDIVQQASNEALEYMADIVQNMNDRQWRKMAVESQAIQMGVGVGIAEHLVPVIYKDMQKGLHKRLKVPKETAVALRQIYIGQVIKHIVKELNAYERNK